MNNPPENASSPRSPGAPDIQSVIRELEAYRQEAQVQTRQLIETQALLEKSRDRYADLYDFAPLAYITLDSQGLVLEINLTGTEMLGVQRSRIIGNLLFLHIVDSDGSILLDHLRRCGEATPGGSPVISELRLLADGGHTVPVQLTSRPARQEQGDQPVYRTAITDLTDVKHTEAALRESQRQLRTLYQTLEHRADQLRALATELTRTEHRERRRLAQTLHDHLQQLLAAAKLRLGMVRGQFGAGDLGRTMEQVSELIDQSLLASRSLTLELSPPVLYDAGLVPALGWLMRWMDEKHGLNVHVDADPDAEPDSEDIRVLLFEAIRELLTNVATHAGVREAWVTLTRTSEKRIRAVVEDDGVGFDPDVIWKTPEGGGFGLFSIRERIELIGGQLDIDTARDQGARITLLAPLHAADINPEAAARLAPPAPGSTPGNTLAPGSAIENTSGGGDAPDHPERIRILLADDHEVLREGLASLLRQQPDLEVIAEAADGREALDLARRHHPDVVVMDIAMPQLNGVEATRRVTAELPDTRVIGLSIHEEKDMAVAMQDAGAAAYLTKEGPTQAIISAIRTAAP